MNLSSYYKSEHWIEFRAEVLEERDRCEECGSNKRLHVHHKNYARIGREREDDVEVLCRNCHDEKHGGKLKKYD